MAQRFATGFIKNSLLVTVVFLTGCQTTYPPMYGYQNTQPMNDYGLQAPLMSVDAGQTQYQQGQMQAPMMGGSLPQQQPVIVTSESDQRVSALTAEITQLQERLARTERAMLRLDRRMQLVEANELSRMEGAQMSALEPATQSVAMVGDSIDTMEAPMQEQSYGLIGGTSSEARMMPVSTSYVGLPGQQQANQQMQGGRSLLGLPSLADKETSKSNDAAAELSVWTVRYQEDKIWPERAQLKSSRDVVAALRQNDKPVAVYARGHNTASKEFRERVRAISRYLSKVSEREQVPIAALPADHLDDDTIEIFTAN